MSFEFLMPDAAVSDDRFSPVARTPMERQARTAGGRFEIRDCWNVAVSYSSAEQESDACLHGAGWADVSHLGKLELQAEPMTSARSSPAARTAPRWSSAGRPASTAAGGVR